MGTPNQKLYTTSTGVPVGHPHPALRVGALGPIALQDFHLIDALAHFAHERIPERVVHAKGAGAHGYFRLTKSLGEFTSSKFFTEVHKDYPLTVRFSTIGGELGSSDNVRDTRGFAAKIKTEEGIFDWVLLNLPAFPLKDPGKLPHLIHSQKRNPQTHLQDPQAFWDFITQNPETAHAATMLFTDRGTPDGYHNMHGFSINTYKLVKADGSFVYIKIHVKKEGGCKNLTRDEASKKDPDYGIKGLYDAIVDGGKTGKLPFWTVFVQTMTPKQAEEFKYNILDPTKTWPQGKYPLRRIGKLWLDKNVENYFAEVEQIAFSPANVIPYFEPSADPVLQARFFVYAETQRYRLGVNFNQLPVNRSKNWSDNLVANFQRDGFMAFDNQGSRPNYKSSFQPLKYIDSIKGSVYATPRDPRTPTHERWVAQAYWDLIQTTEEDFDQPKELIVILKRDTAHYNRFIDNISEHAKLVKDSGLKKKIVLYWAAIDKPTSDEIAEKLGVDQQTHATISATPVKFETRQRCT